MGTGYRLVLLACLVLAGWSLWTGGIFDGPVAKPLRGSSVYADATSQLDTVAAQRVIGNRRLAVAFLDTADSEAARQACKDSTRAADGVLLVIIYTKDDELTSYGCSLLPGAGDDANFGKSFVAESEIADGISGFRTSPLDAVKTMAIKYDQLASTDTVPKDARVIQVSAPRYLLALIAFVAVIAGSAVAYVDSRRLGKAIADASDHAVEKRDQVVAVNATMAGIADVILRVDGRYSAPANESAEWLDEYRALAADYADLAADVSRHAAGRGDATVDALETRAAALSERATELAAARSVRS